MKKLTALLFLLFFGFISLSGLSALHAQPAFGSFLSPKANCHGLQVVAVVAHMDDDILFIDPAISQILAAGGCVTAIYVNGGDSPGDFNRVLVREAASRAAYTTMINRSTTWSLNYVVAGGATIRTLNSDAKPELTQVYIRVWAGNVRYGPLHYLRDLFEQNIPTTTYSYDDADPTNTAKMTTFNHASFTATLSDLLVGFGAKTVYALNPDTSHYVEHPDHTTTARFVREALKTFPLNIPVYYHETYPITSLPANLDPQVIQRRRDIAASFFTTEDGGVAGSFAESFYNGSWTARRKFKVAHAHDVSTNPAIVPQPVVNVETQECLTSLGAELVPAMRPCTGAAAQLWSLTPLSPSIVASGQANTALFVSNAGNCLALQAGVVREVTSCNAGDPSQYWTPWDFGKIYAPLSDNACLDVGASGLTVTPCAVGDTGASAYTASMLWTRNIANFDSGLANEGGLVGDLFGDGVGRLLHIHRRGDGPGFNVWATALNASAKTASSTLVYQHAIVFDQAATPTCGAAQICYDQSRFLLADFNGDGKADLMAVTARQTGTAFWLFANTSSGGVVSFANPVLYLQTTPMFYYSFAQQYIAGDFNGDGRIDVMLAQTRADHGMNFWVLTNNGAGLDAPVQWSAATNIDKTASLYAANLNGDNLADVIAVDHVAGVAGLRATAFVSDGAQFTVAGAQQTFPQFNPLRSRVVAVTSTTSPFLTDLWMLTNPSGGKGFWLWQLARTPTAFGAPKFRRAITTAAWSDVKPLASPNGRQMLLPYRHEQGTLNEFEWEGGDVGVMAVYLTNLLSVDFGKTNDLNWPDSQWRARLN